MHTLQSTNNNTEGEQKKLEIIKRLEKGSAKKSPVKTPQQMDALYFRIVVNKEVAPVVYIGS